MGRADFQQNGKTARRPVPLTCKKCQSPMKELKGHIYHKQRKWWCPKCRKARMQKPK